MNTNLRTLANELSRQEGLKRSAGGVAQMSETLALLGLRWRAMPAEQAIREVSCIINRAGQLSEHAQALELDVCELDGHVPDTEV